MATQPCPRPDAGWPPITKVVYETAPLRRLGESLVALGVLIVLFAFYQLWGTGVLEGQAQRRLEAELTAQLSAQQVGTGPVQRPSAASALATITPADAATITAAELAANPEMGAPSKPPPEQEPPHPVAQRPATGDVIARIEIPSIAVSKAVVQGVDRDSLRKGPGHYPSTALPGQLGNVAFAGHRTTHGAPFLNLDLIEPGDEITVETLNGVFTYEVQAHVRPDGVERGHIIVDAAAVEVLTNRGDNRLTLTACHPKYSARQRIVVSALLVDGPGFSQGPPNTTETAASPMKMGNGIEPVAIQQLPDEQMTALDPPLPDPTAMSALSPGLGYPEPTTLSDPQANGGGGSENSLGWQSQQLDPTVLWATVLALIGHGGWVAGRLWRPRPAYLATAPLAMVPLLLFYVHLDRLLPAF